MAEKKKPAEPVAVEAVYSKEQLVSSKRFQNRRDLLSSLLDHGKQYTFSEVETMIQNFDNKIFSERNDS